MELKRGYQGEILRLNLDAQKFEIENLDPETAENFVGGAGLGIKYLYDEVDPKVDPLGEENKLIFSPGPLTGTSSPSASRMSVTGKSPLTSCVGMSTVGGDFPAEVKFAGFDAIIVEGCLDDPGYIHIDEGEVEFKDADDLWGASTFDSQEFIKRDFGDNVEIACIGPAGENLSKMGCIICGRRAAGRKGLGAVMGSKNLKAIAVEGDEEVEIYDEDEFREATGELLKAMKDSEVLYPTFSPHGTSMVVEVADELGILPAENWRSTGEFPSEGLYSGSQKDYRIRMEACYNCPVACSQVRLVEEGPYQGELSEGPEFETTYSLGTGVGVDYYPAIIAGDRMCDFYGLDTISTGVTIGFAMELFERGIIAEEDTDGLELNFGNHQAVLELIQKIAFRDGFGDLLAEGSREVAKRIGEDSLRYAMQVKGLELPGYDVRGAKAHGLNYATSYTGADHNRGYAFQEIFGIPVPEEVDRMETEGKGELTKWNQDIRTVTCDCSPLCVFILDTSIPGRADEIMSSLVNSATGLDHTPESFFKIGERINNLARAFNVQVGYTREDDTLPQRILEEGIEKGGSKGQSISKEELEEMKDEYYEERGWNEKGIPTQEKLKELELDYVIDDLQ
ncbi:hypothetical protein AKJ61_01295 [candidate division MSBL1 archaeon SCGC-AAA259B11]|uniref:Aldehyde ferredoxin oxidoreductase N-terminal domain-containing protein n=1 Tax=candidate division MSBL1 archaeon SCGC-AAA259B11 TaxID=1698260 RepID=A0A133U7G7_9EURY|nr:hypothetical protein AKJ61_01295 [candidate division MSBL1 archaeon SCGC-AAA259B11]